MSSCIMCCVCLCVSVCACVWVQGFLRYSNERDIRVVIVYKELCV
jgi:hypothetical protein